MGEITLIKLLGIDYAGIAVGEDFELIGDPEIIPVG